MILLRARHLLAEHSIIFTVLRKVEINRTDVLSSIFCFHVEKSNPYYNSLIRDMRVYPDFITEAEEQSLFNEVEKDLNRRRYEFDHWDDAIHGFREINRRSWNTTNEEVMRRIRRTAFPQETMLISDVHVLDLAEDGWIKPHVDSTRFCGNTICGLSLLSDSVMRLTLEDDKSVRCDVLLKQRSLYVMKDDVRFKFAHEILKDEESMFNGIKIPRKRRISLIHRNEK